MAKRVNQKEALARSVTDAIAMWNKDKNLAWNLGTNYTNEGTEYETFINKYLFPKITETVALNTDLGNSFNFLAKPTDFVGQLTEEYVIKDSVPSDMDLSREESLMLKRNYPQMITKLYGPGVARKQKFTLNDNNNRLNWSTLGDVVKYATMVYRKKISDINVDEETEIRSMLIDYANNYISPKNIRTADNIDRLATLIFETMLNIQNNSAKYNEANTASGGAIGRYTTYTNLDDVLILTTDRMKTYLLDTRLANTFQTDGIDMTSHIMSFDDLGGSWKLTEDCTIQPEDVAVIKSMGDYQSVAGDFIEKGVVFTWDISQLNSFKGKCEEVRPHCKDNNLFALVMDANSIRYQRNTAKLNPVPFQNPEFDEWTYWLHYYTYKAISPFYNKIVCKVPEDA